MRITHTFQGKEQVFERETDAISIGRSRPEMPVDLDLAADLSVSRHHARVWLGLSRTVPDAYAYLLAYARANDNGAIDDGNGNHIGRAEVIE